MYIKSIEIVFDDKYNIAIKNVVFNKEFLNNGINYLTETALECIQESNKNINIHKPILESTALENTISIIEELTQNKNKFQKFWWNIVKDNSTLYPIYNLSNVLTDIKVKIIPV